MNTKKHHIPPLSRIGYGASEVGVAGTETLIRIGLLLFYTQTVGLRPDLASYAIALGVIWDGITDPLMGRISDQFNWKGERRRPFFWIGAIGLAASIVLIFNIPHFESQGAKFFYLLVTYLASNTFLTILSVPHLALAGDITKEEQVRLHLFGSRLIFANLGIILATAFPALLTLMGSTNPDPLSSVGLAMAVLVGVYFTRKATEGLDKAPQRENQEGLSEYLASLKLIWKNKPFCLLLLGYMVATVGLTLNSSIALYYYKFFLKLDEVAVRSIIAFFMFFFCLAIPFWIWVARFVTKEKIIIGNTLLLSLLIAFTYPFLPEGKTELPMLIGFVGGIFVGSIVLMDATVTEVADRHSLLHGHEETSLGLYFGFWKMGAKLSRAFALMLTGNALTFIGFKAGELPGESTSRQIGWLFGPGVAIFLFSAVLILVVFSLKKEKAK